MNNNLDGMNVPKSSKKKWGIVLGTLIVVLLLGISFAVVLRTLRGTKNLVLVSSDLQLYLDEENNLADVIQGTMTIPVEDFEGKKTESYKFSLVNQGNTSAGYTIYLVEDEANTMPVYALRYNLSGLDGKLDKIENISDLEVVDGRRKLYTSSISKKTTQDFELRIWLGVQAGNDAKNKVYSVKIEVDATQNTNNYYDDTLNGCDPVLSDNLVPVTIASDGTVKKANLKQEWYNYQNKEWANAVVLEDGVTTYQDGEVIPESNIESYFVWIPRYKYKIFNEGNYTDVTELSDTAVQTIEVEFENKDTPVSSGTKKDEWLSHPAFQAFDSNGFWVGKFETGYRGATTTEEAQQNNSNSDNLIIKPDVYSWRGITLGNSFKASYDYLRSDESHMMKNTEWGAVVYLSHSLYGVNAEIYVNNNSSYLTGCGGDSTSEETNATCKNAYGSRIDGVFNQTTTGNISGVFDMSGGAWEYVMGYSTSANTVGENSEITNLYADFFDNNEWSKYYDKYASSFNTSYSERILGDATGELGPIVSYHSSWYNDYAFFVYSPNPWFNRGGYANSPLNAGAFSFAGQTGGDHPYGSFRVVVQPSKS